MCKFTVLLTSDKETIIVTYGEPVEDAPSIATDLSNDETTRTLAEAIDSVRRGIEDIGAVLFYMHGGPYDPATAAQYSPEKVAEFTVEHEGLHEQFEALTA